MLYQVLVVVWAGLVGVDAWPISPLGEYEKVSQQHIVVQCGDDLAPELEPNQYLTVTFSGGKQNNQDGDCVIKIRADVMDKDTQKFGLWVNGSVTVSDAASGDNCTTSYLAVSDKDDEEDKTGRTVKYCGKEEVSFHTSEDIVRIELLLRNPDVNTAHFSLDVKPHFLCGGVVDEEGNITSPDYPQPYGRDLLCFWRIVAPENTHIELDFSEFELSRKKRGKCLDKVTFDLQDPECGGAMKEPRKVFYSQSLLFVFQSVKNKDRAKGFVAFVSFKPNARKDSLMAKFFP